MTLDFAHEFMPEFEAPQRPEYCELWLADSTLNERLRCLGESDLPPEGAPIGQPNCRDLALPDGRAGLLVLALICEQFWRKDQAHSRTQHVGLGLVLVIPSTKESAPPRALSHGNKSIVAASKSNSCPRPASPSLAMCVILWLKRKLT